MNTSDQTTTPTASEESPILGSENWAPIIQAAFDATSWTVTGLPEYLSIEQAERLLKDMLVQLQEQMPASPDYLGTIQVALDVVNDARDTDHTPESVASSLGIDLWNATKADATRMAKHIAVLTR